MTIYIVDLEAVDTRYTAQWKKYLPKQISKSTNNDVKVISGGDAPQATTPGAFLNFGGTNAYKSKQLEQIAEMFCKGEIKNGDYFLYTDAWNPTVIQLKYMSSLLGVDIRIGGLWHAGSYDPQDFLGRLIGDAPWVRSAEHSMFSCYDDNFFATDFHVNMFAREIFHWNKTDWTGSPYDANSTIQRVGWPMEYLKDELVQYRGMPKENIILFPHRIAPEKQVDIFRDLKHYLPQYEFVVCQDQQLTKNEYHNLLGRSKLIFSANLQETLGISWYEGVIVDTIPMVPDRLSYSEMAIDEFKYNSEWTLDFKSYRLNRQKLADQIVEFIEHYDRYKSPLSRQLLKLDREYFSGRMLYEAIRHEI